MNLYHVTVTTKQQLLSPQLDKPNTTRKYRQTLRDFVTLLWHSVYLNSRAGRRLFFLGSGNPLSHPRTIGRNIFNLFSFFSSSCCARQRMTFHWSAHARLVGVAMPQISHASDTAGELIVHQSVASVTDCTTSHVQTKQLSTQQKPRLLLSYVSCAVWHQPVDWGLMSHMWVVQATVELGLQMVTE